MNADERIARISVKVARSNEHFHSLDAELAAYIATNPCKVATKRDPETRRLVYYIDTFDPVPVRAAAIAGDVIHNMRCALDHLAHELVLVNGGTPTKQTQFPIFDTSEKYESAKVAAVKGMSDASKDAIDALKPYESGNYLLWRIYRLNNIDKHRQLLLAGASSAGGIEVGGEMWERLKATMPPDTLLPELPPLFIKPANPHFPLRRGDVIYIDAPDAEPNQHLRFKFDISFTEPGIGSKGEPMMQTLSEMGDLVNSVILSFKPFLE